MLLHVFLLWTRELAFEVPSLHSNHTHLDTLEVAVENLSWTSKDSNPGPQGLQVVAAFELSATGRSAIFDRISHSLQLPILR